MILGTEIMVLISGGFLDVLGMPSHNPCDMHGAANARTPGAPQWLQLRFLESRVVLLPSPPLPVALLFLCCFFLNSCAMLCLSFLKHLVLVTMLLLLLIALGSIPFYIALYLPELRDLFCINVFRTQYAFGLRPREVNTARKASNQRR